MQLIDALTEIAHSVDQPIIAIDGPAGAGKTTLASTIFLALSPHISTTVIHMDELYPGWESALGDELTKTLTWLSSCHKAKKPLLYSSFNWIANEFDAPKSHPSTHLLILEGVASAQLPIEESLATLMIDFKVASITASPIVEIFPYRDEDVQSPAQHDTKENETSHTPIRQVFSAAGSDFDDVEVSDDADDSEIIDQTDTLDNE